MKSYNINSKISNMEMKNINNLNDIKLNQNKTNEINNNINKDILKDNNIMKKNEANFQLELDEGINTEFTKQNQKSVVEQSKKDFNEKKFYENMTS